MRCLKSLENSRAAACSPFTSWVKVDRLASTSWTKMKYLRITGPHRKVAGHSCPRIPMHAGREERRGGTVGRVWSSRGAQQGVACCTHAGPWLASNLVVPLPTGRIATHLLIVLEPMAGTAAPSCPCPTLMVESLQPSTHCYTFEFIPVKSWAAKDSGAPGNCAGYNRSPSPHHEYLLSKDECGL